MSPVSYRLVESDLKLRAIYGSYRETYNMDGLAFTLMISVLVFAIAWCAVRAIARGDCHAGSDILTGGRFFIVVRIERASHFDEQGHRITTHLVI